LFFSDGTGRIFLTDNASIFELVFFGHATTIMRAYLAPLATRRAVQNARFRFRAGFVMVKLTGALKAGNRYPLVKTHEGRWNECCHFASAGADVGRPRINRKIRRDECRNRANTPMPPAVNKDWSPGFSDFFRRELKDHRAAKPQPK